MLTKLKNSKKQIALTNQELLKNDLSNLKPVPVTRLYRETQKCTKQVIIHEGGARSSKSYSLCQYFIFERLLKKIKYKLLLLRKIRHALKLSTYEMFIDILKDNELYEENCHNKSDLIYTLNDNIVRFTGMDDIGNVKSTGWNDVWLEEVNEFTKKDFIFIKTRISEPGEDNKIFLSYNPEECWVQDLEGKPNIHFIFSNYRDNPYLSKEYTETLESLKDEDEQYYKIYTLGQRAKATNIIYGNYIIDSVYPNTFYDEFYGLDFGFNAPAALIKIGIQRGNDKDLWLTELIYESKLTTPELISLMKEVIPEENRGKPIYADSEDPNAIEQIYNAGFNIIPAEKYAGSVREGIVFSKHFRYHTKQEFVNLNIEGKKYKWRVDKNGNVLDEPVKYLDHLMNAKRYAIFMHFKGFGIETDIKKIAKDINAGKSLESSKVDW